MNIIIRTISILFVLCLLVACDATKTKKLTIGEILSNPSAFDGREIKLKGRVTEVLKIPMVEIKLYFLEDETGKIPVLTDGNVPALNRSIRIKGVVDNVAIVGIQSVGTHIKEIKRLH